MKFWQLEKLCLENAYSVKRVGYRYVWIKNGDSRQGEADTVVETYKEIQKDIQESKK